MWKLVIECIKLAVAIYYVWIVDQSPVIGFCFCYIIYAAYLPTFIC